MRNVGWGRCEGHIKGTMGAKGAQEWRVHRLGWVCKSVLGCAGDATWVRRICEVAGVELDSLQPILHGHITTPTYHGRTGCDQLAMTQLAVGEFYEG